MRPGFVRLALLALLLAGCGQASEPAGPGPEPSVDDAPGAAVAILVDTSGSMDRAVPGGVRKKADVAREALGRMLAATTAFTARKPGYRVRVGLFTFADDVQRIREVDDYDAAATAAALKRIPAPKGSTAIGAALREAWNALRVSGCIRKYVLVVTDGENTKGPPPDGVARELYEASRGTLATYFVAFDTDPGKFAFLRAVGGDVLSAKDETELRAALTEIYEGKILAEAEEDR